MRDRLVKAIESGTEEDLEEALKNFEFYRVPDQGEVHKARQKLKYFETKRGLSKDTNAKKNNVIITGTITATIFLLAF